MGERKPYLRIFVNFLFVIAITLIIIFLVPKVIGFFMPFFIGWIIAMIANPLVRFLEKRVKIVRKHSSALIIIVVLVAVIGILYGIIAILSREIINLVQDIPTLYTNIESQTEKAINNLQGVYDVLPQGAKEALDKMSGNMGDSVGKFVASIGTPSISDASSFAKNIAEVVLMSIITILSAYFFIAEREELVASIKKVTPPTVQKQYKIIVENFTKAVGGYFKAQFKIMIIIAIIIFLGFEILGISYSFLLALGIAFLDFLPFFGTGAVIWPWALLDMISGNYVRAIALMVIYLICQVVKQLLQPKMVGDSIGLSPLSTLVFMFIGYRIKGVLGMIVGIPIGMVLINLYHAGMFDRFLRGIKIIANDFNEYRKF